MATSIAVQAVVPDPGVTVTALQRPLFLKSRSSPACVQRQRSCGFGWYTITPCVEASTRPPGATTRRSSRTARPGSSTCSSVCVHSTSSKLPSGTGISSTVPSSSAAGFATSTPMYSAIAPAKNGSYGLIPQPTSSSRGLCSRSRASAASSRSQRARGSRTAYVGERSDGFRRPSPGSATGREAERDPGERVERQAGDDPLSDPEAADGERPQQPDDGPRAAEPADREGERRGEGRAEQEQPDDAEVGEMLDVEVLDAVCASRRRERECGLVWIARFRGRDVAEVARRVV